MGSTHHSVAKTKGCQRQSINILRKHQGGGAKPSKPQDDLKVINEQLLGAGITQ